MNAPKPLKPIIGTFRDAGRLVNEWRDTLTLGAAAVAGFAAQQYLDFSPLTVLAGTMCAREHLRSQAWLFTPEKVGLRPPSLPTVHTCHSSALVGGGITIAAFCLSFGVNTALSIKGAAQATVMMPAMIGVTASFAMAACWTAHMAQVAGGPKSALRAYRVTMWDYPRKNGGPTITSRIVEKAETAMNIGVSRPDTLRTAANIPAKMTL